MEPQVTTNLGKMKGMQKGSHFEFLGIRYAEPPVGELRYAEPQPVTNWSAIYDTTKYATMAPQVWEDDMASEQFIMN